MLANIPQELRDLPQWVCTDATKVPRNPKTFQVADVTNRATWGTFDEAKASGAPYVGFVLTKDDPYSIIDLDDKPERPLSPEQRQRHQKILEAFASYTERSASGRGYHIVVKGCIPSGVHRDSVEAYSSSRYMICTGNVVRQAPIAEYQELLDTLYREMRPAPSIPLVDNEEILDDANLIAMAMNATNGEKFNALCAGDLGGYPSQSEADFALLSMLAFYSQSNEQVRRLFRMSALGRREKATKNNTYLDFALGKIRAQQPAPVDSASLVANAEAVITKTKRAPKTSTESSKELTFPPGLVGELATYFYQTAVRPVPEIALVAAIALTAGVCGRAYNISGTGLNQYLILLAKTGSGKEGALAGIENLMAAVRQTVPMVDQFLGPAAFASGQALVKVLNDRPCFVSVLGEFGLTLQQLSDHRANSAQLMLRKVLLDLYAKSGWNRTLRSSVYSDTEKNTKNIQAPNVTILGESTPETFYDGLDASHIAEGLIPRFSIVEYTGERPPRNREANRPPQAALVQRFADLVTTSLTQANSGSAIPVQLDHPSLQMMDSFDTAADLQINATKLEVEVQVWNRAHLKALKLAALLATGVNPHQPIITSDLARWAIDFVVADVARVSARFRDGDVGQGDSKQYHDLRRVIEGYFDHPSKSVKERFSDLHEAKVIPYAFLATRTAPVASFRHDRHGATNALRRTLQVFVDSAMLVEIPKPLLLDKYKFSGVAYGIGGRWEK